MGTFSTSSHLRPSRARFGVLAFACSLALLTYLDRICIMQAGDSISADLGLSKADMGLVFSAFLVGYMLLEVPGGWLGDRFGSRRALLGMVLCWSLFTALTGCVWPFVLDSGRHLRFGSTVIPLVFNSLTALLLIRFLFGLGEAGAFPNLTRVLRDWFPFNERAMALGFLWTFARLGGAAAPVVLSALTVMLGWRQAFWQLGLLGVVWCLLLYFRFRDRPEQDPRCNEAELALIQRAGSVSDGEASVADASGSSRRESAGHAMPSWRVLATSLTVWAVCVAAVTINFGWWGFYATWQPEFWSEVHHIKPKDSGWLTGLPFVCGALGTLMGGVWSDLLLRWGRSRRWSRAVVGMTGYVMAGLCLLATGFTTSAWQAETLLCLGFLFNDLTVPIIWAVCTDVGGRFAGTLSGLMNMLGGVGAIISPALLPRVREVLLQHHDPYITWRIIFAGLASSWLLGAFTWLFIDAGKPLEQGQE